MFFRIDLTIRMSGFTGVPSVILTQIKSFLLRYYSRYDMFYNISFFIVIIVLD